MAHFRYKAANSEGKVMNGVIEAASPQEAQRRISERGLRPLQVQAARLSKPRRFSTPAGQSRAGLWALLVLLVLGSAGTALWWFDPLGWFR